MDDAGMKVLHCVALYAVPRNVPFLSMSFYAIVFMRSGNREHIETHQFASHTNEGREMLSFARQIATILCGKRGRSVFASNRKMEIDV